MSGRRESAPDVVAKAQALVTALEAGHDRLGPEARESADMALARAGERLRLGGDHTIVALVGATGSGKSSLFNALSGMEIADVGARRPLTSLPMACVWGADGAGPLLEWLEVPEGRRVTRESVLDADREADLRGLVLLDLPDHDSTAVTHRLEVDRLVGLVDLLVWVVDPQKYADEALHRGYLRPLVGHDEVMVVVLNQVDKLAETEVETCLKDLRRLMDADGLATVRILATSSTRGDGVDELRELLEGVVQGHSAFLTRTNADLDEAARKLAQGLAADEPDARRLPAADTLVSAMASAAGLPVLLDTVAAEYRREATKAVTWPLARSWTALGADPLRRLRLGGQAEGRLRELTRASLATPSPAQRERVDLAVQDVASAVAERLPPRWGQSVREAASPDVDDLAGALDAAVNEVDLTVRRPIWWTLVRVVQYLLVTCAVVGFGWLVVLGLLRWQGSVPPATPHLGSVPLPTALFAGGLVLGALLGWAASALARRGARRRRADAVEQLRAAVGDVAWERVMAPIAGVLDEHRTARQALAAASSRRPQPVARGRRSAPWTSMLLLHPGEGPGNAGGAMRETYVAVAGIVATDPQVRTLDDGRQVMSFRVASTSRRFDGQTRAWVDGHTLWVRVTCWRELADNASRCVRKRDRVLAWGRLHTEQWKGADGVVRSDLSLDAESLGHDLTFGVSVFSRKRRAVDQRTLTDVPTVDQDTGEIIGVQPGAPGTDAESDDASGVAVGAGLPEADDEFDELDDDLADADSVEDPEDVEGDPERVLVGSA